MLILLNYNLFIEKIHDFFEKETFGQDSFNQASAFEPFGKPQSKTASPFEPFGTTDRKNTPTFEAFEKSDSNAFDAFGKSESKAPAFDAFGKDESKSNAFDAFGKSESNSNAFDAFGNTEFGSNSTTSTFEPFGSSDFSNNNVKNGNGDAFDPFGLAVTDTKKNKNSTAPGFGFEGDFANFDAFNNNGNDAWGSTTKVKKSNDDGFASWGKKENSMGRIKKSKEPEVKKIDKFSSDYSDNYESDLNEILKRSMIDQ